MNENIVAMARSLARAIQKDESYLKVLEARDRNSRNAALNELIGRFNLARFNLNAELSKQPVDNAKIEIFNKEINEVYAQITADPGMVNYYAAKQELDELTSLICLIVNGAAEGQDPDTITLDACTHDCSTCGGCG